MRAQFAEYIKAGFLDEAGDATEAAKRRLTAANKTYSKVAGPKYHIGRGGPINKSRTFIGVARRIRHGCHTMFQLSSQMGVVLTKR
jgi:hypothetical protein